MVRRVGFSRRWADRVVADTFPLFPLQTVLVPGATLGLRIFETRYLDLVRDCGRSGTGFGICLILDGDEAGEPAMPAAVGTEARIEDFGSTDDGLLMLRVRGARRFQVRRTQTRSDGLVVAEVDWCDPDPDDELRPEHGLLGSVLQQVIEQAGGEFAKVPPSRFDDAAWVGWRLAELLPLSNLQRQMLLQENDPHARLDRLLALMP
ncbi:MAG: ATP-dependent protease [Lysobacter sp.]|nr:ATP-dependent protease [Lysobacter sp.]